MSENNRSNDIKTILRLFPYIGSKEKATRLQIDNESLCYISLREHAESITKIILNHVKLLNLGSAKNLTITDATAGVGGNTLSFASTFKSVNAIELDKDRALMLRNNVDVYEYNNVIVINDDCVNILKDINSHIVFIDPPWGGSDYKNFKTLRLTLSGVSIEKLINRVLKRDLPKIIVLKLPKNYDINYLYQKINSDTIFFHDLKRMFILVIINEKK